MFLGGPVCEGGPLSAWDTQQFVLIVHIWEKSRSPLDLIHVKPCGKGQRGPECMNMHLRPAGNVPETLSGDLFALV